MSPIYLEKFDMQLNARLNVDPRLRRHPVGFLQVSEMPTEEELKTFYTEKYAQGTKPCYGTTYTKQELAWFSEKTRRMDAVVRQYVGGGRFLDVGCGPGFALSWMSHHGWEVTGLDYSRAAMKLHNPDMLDRTIFGDVGKGLESLMNAGQKFAFVALLNVLEHASDPVSLLRSIRGLVGAGGVAFIVVPNDGCAYQEALLSEGIVGERYWVALPDHLAYFDLESLKAIAANTGWECLRVYSEFPIEWFLANPNSNYVGDRTKGPGAHLARLFIEGYLSTRPMADVIDFYESMAKLGMGRDLAAVFRPVDG
jgi:2-polyprenyl-3-methyl-5-hydroxy-6-metoxy-1,4-benzoquinol methylase